MNASLAQRLSGSVLAISTLCATQRALAQAPPLVTGLSGDYAATITMGERAPEPLRLMMALPGEEARVEVVENRQIMVYDATGEVALVALGPAQLVTRVARDRIEFELISGRLMTVSPTAQDVQRVYLLTPAVGEDPRALECPVGPGRTFLTRIGRQVGIGYLGRAEQAGALHITANGKPTTVATGERLVLDGTTVQRGPLVPWLADNEFDVVNWGRQLGVSTARIRRQQVEEKLFEDVIEWDREAQPSAVVTRLRAEPFRPEIRQVAIAVGTQVPGVTGAGVAPRVPPFAAANEVPPLSPAAISVGGVTALSLNESARRLLTETGSRGLGFNGLRQLAIPGFGLTGVRTIGPAGLGAR